MCRVGRAQSPSDMSDDSPQEDEETVVPGQAAASQCPPAGSHFKVESNPSQQFSATASSTSNTVTAAVGGYVGLVMGADGSCNYALSQPQQIEQQQQQLPTFQALQPIAPFSHQQGGSSVFMMNMNPAMGYFVTCPTIALPSPHPQQPAQHGLITYPPPALPSLPLPPIADVRASLSSTTSELRSILEKYQQQQQAALLQHQQPVLQHAQQPSFHDTKPAISDVSASQENVA